MATLLFVFCSSCGAAVVPDSAEEYVAECPRCTSKIIFDQRRYGIVLEEQQEALERKQAACQHEHTRWTEPSALMHDGAVVCDDCGKIIK